MKPTQKPETRKYDKYLQEVIANYEDMYENAPDMFVSVDANTSRIRQCNQTLATALGYSKKEIIGRPVFDMYHPDCMEEVQKTFQLFKETGKVHNAKLQLKRKDGTRIDVALNVSSIHDEQGNILYSRSIWRDITEFKQTKDVLRLREEELRAIIESTTDGILVTDNHSKIIHINNSMAKMWHIPEELIKTKDDATLLEYVIEQLSDPQVFLSKVQALYKSSEIDKDKIYFKDGRIFDRLSSPLILDNKIAGRVWKFQDITERKHLEAEQTAIKNFYASILDGIINGVWVADKDDIIFYANKRMGEIAGIPSEKIIKVNVLTGFPEDTLRYFKPLYNEAKKTMKPLQYDSLPIVTSAGRSSYQSGWLIPRQLEGKYNGMICTVEDITEHKKALEALQESEEFTRAVMDHLPIGVAVNSVDPVVDFTYTNDNFQRFYRTTREALADPDAFWNSVYEDPEFREDIKKRVLEGCASGDPDRMHWEDIPITRKGEATTFICARNIPIPGKHLMISTVWDITERKNAEIDLSNAFKEIKRLKEQLEAENIYLRKEVKLQHEHEEILGQSDAIKRVLKLVERVAGTDSTVLILGETGTGKELLAQSIHNLSKRKSRPMVKVNCAAIPVNLIESELFGREKGAYTGALTTQVGRFEVADGSTIFLDEIGELSSELQAKLLRVLQDGSLERLGSTRTIKVDVRVITATNRDLEQAVEDGTFRTDLYYRLNVFPIQVPPLRERHDDIMLLVWAFVREFEREMGKQIENVPKVDIQAMQNYSWPGNVRELKNLIERSMILTSDSTLHIKLPQISTSRSLRNRTLNEIEKDYIISVLEKTKQRIRGGNGAAEILGLKPTTLDARIKKLGIKR